jgi:hypothetical protein
MERIDLRIDQGADWSQTWTLIDSDGDPVNLTGGTAAFQVREKPADQGGSALLSLTSGSGITLGGTAGTVAVSISDTQSEDLVPYDLLYGLEVTVSGVTTRVSGGRLTVSPEVVR